MTDCTLSEGSIVKRYNMKEKSFSLGCYSFCQPGWWKLTKSAQCMDEVFIFDPSQILSNINTTICFASVTSPASSLPAWLWLEHSEPVIDWYFSCSNCIFKRMYFLTNALHHWYFINPCIFSPINYSQFILKMIYDPLFIAIISLRISHFITASSSCLSCNGF